MFTNQGRRRLCILQGELLYYDVSSKEKRKNPYSEDEGVSPVFKESFIKGGKGIWKNDYIEKEVKLAFF